jgi:hypothetical protein
MFTTVSAGEPFYIEAYANLCDNYKLSSPQFDDSYSPWLAGNQCATKTNHATGALSAKNSYTYQLIPSKSDQNKSVSYISPYTYRKPATNSGGFSDQDNFDAKKKCWGLHLDNITGDLNIYPTNEDEIFPLAVEMISLSNGKVVSRVTRDLLYWVIPFINENRHPIVTGIDCQQPVELTLEPFQSKCFTICSFDPDPEDTVKLSAEMEMTSASFLVEQGKRWPKAQFCWGPKLTDEREEPYKLIVRAEDNFCSDVIGVLDSSSIEKIFLIYVKASSGIKEAGPNNLKIYPQPASSKVYAQIPEHSVRKVALIDMTGRSLTPGYSIINENLELDISFLPAGSYLLQVLTDKNMYSGRVILTR